MSRTRAKFTGGKRYRPLKRFMRATVLVLQLEVEGFIPEYTGEHEDVMVEGEICKWWVDATIENLTIEATP